MSSAPRFFLACPPFLKSCSNCPRKRPMPGKRKEQRGYSVTTVESNKMLYYNYLVIMDAIKFDWDKKKAALNLKKHGISFKEAKSVFRDQNARLIHDPEHSDVEERFILLGLSLKMRILVVVHCYRENAELIRIVSARRASNNERKQYEELLK